MYLRSTLKKLVPLLIAAVAFGCDSPADPAEQEVSELSALYERAIALHTELSDASELSPPLQDALGELVVDFRAYEVRHNRDDILERDRSEGLPLATGQAAIDPGPGPGPVQCKGPCPLSVRYSPTRICFLTSMTCDSNGRNTACYYHFCINIPSWFYDL